MNIIGTTGLLAYLQMHGYAIMLLMMFVEGASVTYISAFLASTGVFNIYAVIFISIFGFVIEDMILYFIGKYWGRKFLVKRFYSKSLGKRLKKLQASIRTHPGKTITIVKISPFIPIPGLMLIGASRVPIKKFLYYSIIISMAYSLVFTVIGFYSGMAFNVITKDISNNSYVIGIAVILVIGTIYLVRYTQDKIEKRAEEFGKRKK